MLVDAPGERHDTEEEHHARDKDNQGFKNVLKVPAELQGDLGQDGQSRDAS